MNKAKVAIVRTRKANGRRRRNGANGIRRTVIHGSNGAEQVVPPRARHRSFLREPKNELESAIQRYVDLYDFAPIAFVSFDRAGRIEEANLAATELLGLPRDLLIGRPFALFVADSDAFLRHLLYCRTSEQRVDTELRLKPRKADPIPVQLSSTPITSTSKNGARLYQTAILDLRERKAAETVIRASEERLRATVEQAAVGMDRCDFAGRFTFVNQKLCQMLGYRPSELIGKSVPEITHPDDVETNMKLFERMSRTGQPFEFEKRFVRKDGSFFWAIANGTAIRDAKGKPVSAVAIVIDITERKKIEAALQESKNLLERRVVQRTQALRRANTELENEIKRRKGLEGEILAISDREQQRLGQELHDGLCQQLTAIGFMARANALRLRDHRVVEVDDLEKIAQLINSSVMDARNIAHDIHKEEVDAASFEQALRDLVERKIWKTRCRLQLKTKLHIEDDEVGSQLYRILREALINANKHAHATEIILEVRQLKNNLVLGVKDNGVGFREKMKRGHGLGFHIMKYRAQSIGARLELESSKRGGTRVAVYLPLGK